MKTTLFFLLILFSTSSFAADAVPPEWPGPLAKTDTTYSRLLNELLEDKGCCCIAEGKELKRAMKSYDPHSQLIHFTELEAGRINFYMDAYMGQSLCMKIQNKEGEVVANLDTKKVDQDHIQVDLAAWDCGTYYVLVIDTYGEVSEYSFVID